jgi:hypothetical protein
VSQAGRTTNRRGRGFFHPAPGRIKGGITLGLDRAGLDLSEALFFEIRVNDGHPDINLRQGKLHIDFGTISEDGIWPIDNDGNLVVGAREDEDTNQDGVFVGPEEDIGLDGNEFGPQRYQADYEIDGDHPYPRINGTARNNREDSEDINHDTYIHLQSGYFTMTIDLQLTPAAVDVVYDFDNVDDLVAQSIAWRKYRIPLASVDLAAVDFQPNIDVVTQLRLWYEDSGPLGKAARSLQFSGLKFVMPD